MHYTIVSYHRTGRARAFVHRDPSLRLLRAGSGYRHLKRMGMPAQIGLGFRKIDNFYANMQYQHAWPLLSHDDLGNSDQSNNTHNILYSMYMPKRNKGTAPWFRGADTYSVKYCEQGRYEYQRYLMINRFPSEYKKHFLRFLNNIRAGAKSNVVLPQETLHWLMRMIVDNFNPQHVHYIAAMQTLLAAQEIDMARDVWKIMERQQTWPDTSTLCAYLDICIASGEKTWAIEAWNRYATELKFLSEGEVDPKPITRTPFSLSREELLYLPKWKKHFDHDPNLDVIDLNRFNRTREVYLRMSLAMFAGGDRGLSEYFFRKLEEAMLTTPTPVPEPPNPHLVRQPRWSPHEHLPSIHASPWRMQNNGRVMAMGPSKADEDEMQSRFFTNPQFLIHATKELIAVALQRYQVQHPDVCGPSGITEKFFEPASTAEDVLTFCDALVERLWEKLGDHLYHLETSSLLSHILAVNRIVRKETGRQLHVRANAFITRKAALGSATAAKGVDPSMVDQTDPVKESLTAPNYLQILSGLADESSFVIQGKGRTQTYTYRPGFDPRTTMKDLSQVVKEISTNPHVAWSADMHLQIVRSMVGCGTMKANDYFVNNVLRQFSWESEFLEALYIEYRRQDDVDTWAELTKRALVWTARYDVQVSESLKRRIEDDYDVIEVQTRTFRELAVFQFRDVEEKRQARNVVNELPNPWIDYVAHALPFPDRDGGYPDEYGDIGQWRAPGGPGSPVKGPGYYAPPMEGEHHRGYTAEWRDLKNPMRPPPFPNPWDRKYAQYARGQHPSYDMVYAGPMPTIFPDRHNFRKPTRWDFHDIEKQGKFKISGPY
ncbi:unnamed protein product [Phytomonas sp. Hart1]|nr:unnamed protein product [Phytomonas sp. Hart1]|eukprot:CCW66051.1 unnamed protein product [Phytomonas sp. isolate Hart1]